MTRYFLAGVGVAYLILAIWCIVKPGQTSNSVGFTLQPGSGQSEYLVVYGGLQIGLGLMFLWPLLDAGGQRYALVSCLLIHGSLVAFRTIGFLTITGIQTTTYTLAAVEWAIFLGSLWRYQADRGSTV